MVRMLDKLKKLYVKRTSTTNGPISILASDEKPIEQSVEGELRQLLIDNPNMNGATLLNTIKSKGMKVVKNTESNHFIKKCAEKLIKRKSVEADSASGNAQALRSDVKSLEKAAVKSPNMRFLSTFLEAAAADDGVGFTKFKVILLQEGMGNMKDAYYYSKEALRSAITVFEGKKIYADHPSAFEEQARPERSVKDVLGHFENVSVVESDDGRSMLTADVVILPDEPYRWARALMRHSVDYAKKYPDKDFVGLSINASGEAQPVAMSEMMSKDVPESAKVKMQKALQDGIETVRYVTEIKEAVSCDLVTEAGAGGKVLEMLERENTMSKKKDGQKPEVTKNIEGDVVPAKGEGAEGKDPSKLAAESDGAEKHSDAEQDKELIKKMIAEYLGDDDIDNAEVAEMCKEAYEAYCEMGYSTEEAMKCAGHAMKLAKHMAAKEMKQADEKPADKKDEKEMPAKEAEETVEAKDDKEKEGEAHKESSEVIKLRAEIAGLRESMKAIEVEKHLEKTLKESGLPRSVTQVFRDNLGAHKTTKEIDEKFKLFVESYKAARGSATDAMPFIVTTEKRGETNSSLSFADCLK